MLWTLVRKELLSNLLTLRLAVALAFSLLLSVMAAVIGSAEYSQNVDRYGDALQEYQSELLTIIQQRLAVTRDHPMPRFAKEHHQVLTRKQYHISPNLRRSECRRRDR